MDTKAVKELIFQNIYPPEGCSSILEVCDQDDIDFLHVSKDEEGKLIFRFVDATIVLSEEQMDQIIAAARRNITYVDPDSLFDEGEG